MAHLLSYTNTVLWRRFCKIHRYEAAPKKRYIVTSFVYLHTLSTSCFPFILLMTTFFLVSRFQFTFHSSVCLKNFRASLTLRHQSKMKVPTVWSWFLMSRQSGSPLLLMRSGAGFLHASGPIKNIWTSKSLYDSLNIGSFPAFLTKEISDPPYLSKLIWSCSPAVMAKENELSLLTSLWRSEAVCRHSWSWRRSDCAPARRPPDRWCSTRSPTPIAACIL